MTAKNAFEQPYAATPGDADEADLVIEQVALGRPQPEKPTP